MLIRTQNLTEELRERVQDSELVQGIKEYPALASYKIMIGDKEVNNTWLFEKMCPEYSVLNERGDGYKTRIRPCKKVKFMLRRGFYHRRTAKYRIKSGLRMRIKNTNLQ